MGKLLFWIVIILAVMIAMRILKLQKARTAHVTRAAQTRQRHGQRDQATEEMVPCAHCGVYTPVSQAIRRSGQYWCSHDHARLGPPKP